VMISVNEFGDSFAALRFSDFICDSSSFNPSKIYYITSALYCEDLQLLYTILDLQRYVAPLIHHIRSVDSSAALRSADSSTALTVALSCEDLRRSRIRLWVEI